jgi:hypothetical protein
MLLGSVLVSDQFVRYIAVFAASVYKNFENSGAVNIIVRIRVMIVLFDRSAILF